MEYRIGDFSLVARLPVKTLRYYHEAGILPPSRIDPMSGYRWYDDAALERAVLIKKLRDLDFGIDEIARLLEGGRSRAELDAALGRKARELDAKIERFERIRAELELELRQGRPETAPSDPVESAEFPACRVASLRFTGAYSEVGKAFGLLARRCGRWISGPPMTLYRDAEYRDGDADLEACVPISAETPAGAIRLEGAMALGELEPVRAVAATHLGPYETIGGAYRRAFDYMADRGLAPTLPSREIYVRGPGPLFRGDPAKYLTRVVLPYRGP